MVHPEFKPVSPVKMALRILALVIAFGSLSVWLATGASRGWTKTSVPVKQMDAVTGIEGVTYEKRFVPGVDFVSASLLAAAALAGFSLFFGNQTKQTVSTHPTT
jgi:hypothetical protein